MTDGDVYGFRNPKTPQLRHPLFLSNETSQPKVLRLELLPKVKFATTTHKRDFLSERLSSPLSFRIFKNEKRWRDHRAAD
jgi:hypothetical protein